MVASITRILFRLYLFSSVLTYHRVMPQIPTNEQLVIIIFIKSVIPSVSGQEMSLINHFKWQVRTTGQLAFYLLSFIICQVASPNNWTTGISLLSVNHMPSGKSEQPDNWHLPFISQSFQMASPDNWHLPFISQSFQMAGPNNQTACIFPFNYIVFQVISPKQWTAWVYLLIMFRAVSPKQWTARVFTLFRAVSPQKWTSRVFTLFRAVSPKQWIAQVLPCFERSVVNNGQLEFIFRRVSSRQS